MLSQQIRTDLCCRRGARAWRALRIALSSSSLMWQPCFHHQPAEVVVDPLHGCSPARQGGVGFERYVEGLGCCHVAVPLRQSHLPLLEVVGCGLGEGNLVVPAGSSADVLVQVAEEETGWENCTRQRDAVSRHCRCPANRDCTLEACCVDKACYVVLKGVRLGQWDSESGLVQGVHHQAEELLGLAQLKGGLFPVHQPNQPRSVRRFSIVSQA